MVSQTRWWAFWGGGAGEVGWWASICIGGPIRQFAMGRIAPPQTQYIYLEVEYIYISKRNIYLEVNTTSNMVHQLTDIYIPHAHAYSPRTIGGWGAPWWVTPGGVPGGWRPNPRPKDQSRDFTIFQTTKSSKNGNVTQLLKKVAQFVWCFGRARTTPIQKLSPAAFSSHFNCTFSFYTPNGVGEYV